jgi:hypothetical protein
VQDPPLEILATFAVGAATGDRRRSLAVGAAAVPLDPSLEVVPVFLLCDAAAAATAAVRCKIHRPCVGTVAVVAVGNFSVGAVAVATHFSSVVVPLVPSFPWAVAARPRGPRSPPHLPHRPDRPLAPNNLAAVVSFP